MGRRIKTCSVFYISGFAGVLCAGLAGCVEPDEPTKYDRLVAQSTLTRPGVFRASDVFPPPLKTADGRGDPDAERRGLASSMPIRRTLPSNAPVNTPRFGGLSPSSPSVPVQPARPPVERTLTGAVSQSRGAAGGMSDAFWTVQVGAFSAMPNAERKMAGFRQSFCNGTSDPTVCNTLQVVCSDLRYQGRVYRVRLGAFRDQRMAEGYCARLGHDCWTARVDAPQQPGCRG